MQRGHNTALINKNERNVLAHPDQIRSRIEEEDMDMEEKSREEENFAKSDTEEFMQSEKEEHHPQPKDSSGDEIQSRLYPMKISPTLQNKKKGKVIQGCKTFLFPGAVVILTNHVPCVDKMI